MQRIFHLCLSTAAASGLLLGTVPAAMAGGYNGYNNGYGAGGGRGGGGGGGAVHASGVSAPHVGGFAGARGGYSNFRSGGVSPGRASVFTNHSPIVYNHALNVYNPSVSHTYSYGRGNYNSAGQHIWVGPRGTVGTVPRPQFQNTQFHHVNMTNHFGAPGTVVNPAATRAAFVNGRSAGSRGTFNARFPIASNRFAFRTGAFHPGWNPGRRYYWNRCHWRCFNGVWAVVGIGWPYDWNSYPYPFYYDNAIYYNGDTYDVASVDNTEADYPETVDNSPVQAPAQDNTTETAPADDGSSLVADIQQGLANQGYYAGPVDGLLGQQTSAAISAYQQDHGMMATGRINGPLLDSLGL